MFRVALASDCSDLCRDDAVPRQCRSIRSGDEFAAVECITPFTDWSTSHDHYAPLITRNGRELTPLDTHAVFNSSTLAYSNCAQHSIFAIIICHLHWLPIQYRIQFKIAVFMHQCFHCRCPQYIFDLVSFRTATGRLRSATTRAAVRHSSTTDQSRQTSILNRQPFCLEQFASIS